MRRSRLSLVIGLIACLSYWYFAGAKVPSESIVGTWELVGFGDVQGDFIGPRRLLIAIDPSGKFDYQILENDGGASFRVSGDWVLTDAGITMTPRAGDVLNAAVMVYGVAWDRGTLLLHEEGDGNGDTPPARFARSIANAP